MFCPGALGGGSFPSAWGHVRDSPLAVAMCGFSRRPGPLCCLVGSVSVCRFVLSVEVVGLRGYPALVGSRALPAGHTGMGGTCARWPFPVSGPFLPHVWCCERTTLVPSTPQRDLGWKRTLLIWMVHRCALGHLGK